MDRLPTSEVEQSDLDWIHSYPFTMDPARPPVSMTQGMPASSTAHSWRPSLGLNTFDFGMDDAASFSPKFETPQSGWQTGGWHPGLNAVSPPSSLFPSVSSVQSSPHTSPASVDPNLRANSTSDMSYSYPMPRDHLRTSTASTTSTTSGKRQRTDFESQQLNRAQVQQQGPPRNVKLDEENRYLVYLRDQQRLPWKEISRKFEQTFQRPYQAPALQMRYGRLKNRLHPWTEADTTALQMAQEYYANKRFEIIAEKMLEFGATDIWAPRICARKLRQLEKEGNAALASPTMSRSSEEPQEADDATLRHASPQLPGGPSWSAR